MEFINRELELTFLNDTHNHAGGQLIIIYGKRRVGKTELIKQFIKGKHAVYYLADKRTTKDQLKELGKLLGLHFNDFNVSKRGFSDWVDVLRYISEKQQDDTKFIFAVDEYPYLIESDESTQSQFQKGFDEYLKKSNVTLILTGSSISMMENEVLGHRSPLYGRRTGDLLVDPLDFKHSHKFYEELDFDNFLNIYSLAGGMPEYLLQLQERSGGKLQLDYPENQNIWDTFKKKVLTKNSFLYREAEYLLREELKEPRTYMAILRAISLGKHKASKIAETTGIEATSLPKYFGILRQLRIIHRDIPITEKNLEKSKKSLYFFEDNYMRSWFRFVYPNKSNLEIGNFSEAKRKFDLYFPSIVQSSYESIARQFIYEHQDHLFNFERVGRWWNDGKNIENTEIDIVATNEDEDKILFGEVKWTEKKLGTNILSDLKSKASRVEWGTKDRKEHFVLFSKNGFTDNLKAEAQEEGVLLIHKDSVVTT